MSEKGSRMVDESLPGAKGMLFEWESAFPDGIAATWEQLRRADDVAFAARQIVGPAKPAPGPPYAIPMLRHLCNQGQLPCPGCILVRAVRSYYDRNVDRSGDE